MGKLEAFHLSAAPACGLIRRGYSPANLSSARYAMAAQPAARKGWPAQQTKASGPGDQARPRGPQTSRRAATAARCVPSRTRSDQAAEQETAR